jgi:hypothetical protein
MALTPPRLAAAHYCVPERRLESRRRVRLGQLEMMVLAAVNELEIWSTADMVPAACSTCGTPS